MSPNLLSQQIQSMSRIRQMGGLDCLATLSCKYKPGWRKTPSMSGKLKFLPLSLSLCAL